jgi:hypothetical protein
MAFDLHITVPENSPAAHVVQQIAAAEHISPEQAATRLLTEAAKLHGKKTPAQELIGAFSSPEDRALMDDAMGFAKKMREIDAQRNFEI